MKTPTWALTVGILMMLFGGCSVSNRIQSINMPEMVKKQEKIFGNLSETMSESLDSLEESSNSFNRGQAEMIENFAEEMFNVSEHTLTWTVRFGYIGMFVTLIYVLGGVFMIIRKPFSINLAYAALILSILFSIIQSVVLAEGGGFFTALSAGLSSVFGIMIDMVFIVVIVASDKSAFQTVEQ